MKQDNGKGASTSSTMGCYIPKCLIKNNQSLREYRNTNIFLPFQSGSINPYVNVVTQTSFYLSKVEANQSFLLDQQRRQRRVIGWFLSEQASHCHLSSSISESELSLFPSSSPPSSPSSTSWLHEVLSVSENKHENSINTNKYKVSIHSK